jgi:hypothetical protein
LDTPKSSIDRFTTALTSKIPLVLSQRGAAYLVINGRAIPIGSRQSDSIIREQAAALKYQLRRGGIVEINDYLLAKAVAENPVWSRVAPIPNGVEIDLCNGKNTRVIILPGSVEVVGNSNTLFCTNQLSLPLPLPAAHGDLALLRQHVNLSDAGFIMLKAHASYTLASPKISSTNFVILIIKGGFGSGKTVAVKCVIAITDPSRAGLQKFPRCEKDLALAAQHSHVLAYDNVRSTTKDMSDILCLCSTGGSISTRALYTDSQQNISHLHAALIFTSIHDFIVEPDLAQRCLTIHALPILESERKSESEMDAAFEADYPVIFRGLLDLISNILVHLPTAKVTHPERMYDFVRWLAAMEMADGVAAGTYQAIYSEGLREEQRDTLLQNSLAAAVIEFVADLPDGSWTGTPASLFDELCGFDSPSDFPTNAISLSKRLLSLQSAFLSQSISVSFNRGKFRTITLTNTGA